MRAVVMMRRQYIYPHRSIRSFPIPAARIALALLSATVISAAVALASHRLLAIHSGLCSSLLAILGIPLAGLRPVETFAFFGSVLAPQIPTLWPYGKGPLWALVVLLVPAVLAFLLLYRNVKLARGFVIFLLTLLLLSAAAVVALPDFHFDSSTFTQIWIRNEVIVWTLLPWVSAYLLLLTAPSPGVGLALTALVQIFGFAWSVVRLAFCLGVLHYTGVLFVPLLWFALGLLADVLYVCVFYSISVHLACKAVWERR